MTQNRGQRKTQITTKTQNIEHYTKCNKTQNSTKQETQDNTKHSKPHNPLNNKTQCTKHKTQH